MSMNDRSAFSNLNEVPKHVSPHTKSAVNFNSKANKNQNYMANINNQSPFLKNAPHLSQ